MEPFNARLTEQFFDVAFVRVFCTKGDSEKLSGAAAC
jgi:hypothetical protein